MAPLIDEEACGVVQVVPLLKLSHLGDRRYDYRVPTGLSGRIVVGSVVNAPFGRRSARAVVVGLEGAGEGDPAGLRDLEAVADQSIPEELVTLAGAVAERYLSTLESCLRLVVPPTAGSSGIRGGRPQHAWVTRSSEPSAQGVEERPLTAKQKALLGAIPPGGASRCTAVQPGGSRSDGLEGAGQQGIGRTWRVSQPG